MRFLSTFCLRYCRKKIKIKYGRLCNKVEIIKKVYQGLLLAEERLADVVYCSEDQWGEDKLKRVHDDIDELCKKYPWFHELGRGFMVQA